jgi:hypothetical protein
MDPIQLGHYKLVAENQYLKLKRTDFQAWVTEILEGVYPTNFMKVRLAQGDHQLDGVMTDGTAFAIYAPRDTTWKESETQAKINSDFAGAKSYLTSTGGQLTRWVFVHNDPDGLTAVVAASIQSLQSANTNIKIRNWGFEAIWQEIQRLPTEKLQKLFGPAPTAAAFQNLGFAGIQPVLEFVRAEEAPLEPPLEPPSIQKLEYNKLSPEIAAYLQMGRRKASLVGKYIESQHDPIKGEEIAQACRDRYRDLRNGNLSADSIFSQMHEFVGGSHFGSSEHLSAVCAVLAYFFDSCDIFENPPKHGTSN